MSILAALNKAKQQKKQELEVQLQITEEQPENSYWKRLNGIWYIGNEGFKSSLQLIGLCDEIIEDLMLEDKKERENLLDYFNKQVKIKQQTDYIIKNKDCDRAPVDRTVRLIVCAAVRNKYTGEIVCGARHGNCLNAVIRYGLDSSPLREAWECGFIDQDNEFLSRIEAWEVADAAGQIRRPLGFEEDYSAQRGAGIGDDGMLFSENLY
jgi:hypothetical protein